LGCRPDPDSPGDAAAVRVERGQAALVAQLSGWYLEPQATLHQLTTRLPDLTVVIPAGKSRWTWPERTGTRRACRSR
jgi:hypothetical protein